MNLTYVKLASLLNDTGHYIGNAADVNGHHGNHNGTDSHNGHNGSHEVHGVHVVSWNFEYVAQPLIVVLFILVAMFLKLGFHYASFLSSKIPESCLLILTGTIFGAILKACGLAGIFSLDPRTFLLFLLPPIVLDSAYSLHDRVFMENLGQILVYAVIGTVLNFVLLGPTLYGLAEAGAMGNLTIGSVDCLLFSSFIVAVDPVAVLAVFQEIGVNDILYFLVFGESLLNDAVTVVLSSMMKVFVDMEVVPPREVGLGIASFFTISLGGLFIGIMFGVFTALVTKRTNHVRLVEPLALLMMAYAAYLVAELFHWSGIISMIGCGLVQAAYSFHNIARKSKITVNYFVKMISSSCDIIIFLFLGIELVSVDHIWHPGFILWTLFFCLLYRFIVTFFLTFCLNKFTSKRKLNYEEQFIMWYGGLRGAVCFALCDTIRNDYVHKQMFLTTTLVVIIFTVFIQGSTIKPLVKLCRIQRKDEDTTKTMFEELNLRVTDHMMTAVEVVNKHKGANYIRNMVTSLNDNYLQKWFQKDPLTEDQKIVEEYANLLLRDYEDNIHKTYLHDYYHDIKHGDVKGPVGELETIPEGGDPNTLPRELTSGPSLPSPRPSPGPSRRPLPRSMSHDPEGQRRLPDDESAEAALKRHTMATQPRDNRKSMADTLLGKRSMNLLDPKKDDMKQLLKDSGFSSRQQKYDRNLLGDDKRDLEFILHEKRLRMNRLRRMGVQSSIVVRDGSSARETPLCVPQSPRPHLHSSPGTEESQPLISPTSSGPRSTASLPPMTSDRRTSRSGKCEMLTRQNAQAGDDETRNNNKSEGSEHVQDSNV